MFIGNGGGVLLAYDDGEFKVPGRTGKPKRIRFPGVVPETKPAPVVHAIKPTSVVPETKPAPEPQLEGNTRSFAQPESDDPTQSKESFNAGAAEADVRGDVGVEVIDEPDVIEEEAPDEPDATEEEVDDTIF